MILVFAEHQQGKFKKPAFEAVTFGHHLAEAQGTDCCALVVGKTEDPSMLGKYGATKVYQVNHDALAIFDSRTWAHTISTACQQLRPDVLIMSHTATGKSLIGRVAVRLEAGSLSGIHALHGSPGNWEAERTVFSGKAFASYTINTPMAVVSLIGNALRAEISGATCPVESLKVDVPEPRITVREVNRLSGKVPLPEAELVVSAGRGMKGPENWGIVEELAEALGASLACSRPVADSDWRPHHEHVGQTGVAIRPNLYIAIGISGAIQHLAGVNNSRTIVVINKDPEAPFFKAADYGVCADLFEVVPKMTEAVRKFKAEHA